MGKKHLPHRYLTRYLFSLLLILLIPLSVLGIILYDDVISLLEYNALENNRERLYAVRDDFARRMTELAAISSAISGMDMFRRTEIIPRDFVNDWNIREELGRFSLSNDAIEEIVLYIPATETYYSSSGIYQNPWFFRDIYPFDAFSTDDLEILLAAQTNRQWAIYPEQKVTLANTGAANVIPAAFTVPFGSFSPYGILLFLISTDSLDRAYESYGFPEESLLQLEDGRGLLIYRRGKAGDSPAVARAELDKFSLGFMSAVPSSHVREQAAAIQNKALISLAVIFLLALILIPYLAISGYSPIRQLILLSSRFLPDVGKAGKNELSLIGDAISDLAVQRDMINSKLDKNRRVLQNHLLKGLATGRDISPAEIGALEKELDIHLKKQQYCLFLWDGPVSRDVPAEWSNGKHQVFTMKSGRTRICLLTGTLRLSRVDGIITDFLKDARADRTVSRGRIVASLSRLRESYAEAMLLNRHGRNRAPVRSVENLPDPVKRELEKDADPPDKGPGSAGKPGLRKLREELAEWSRTEDPLAGSLKLLNLICRLDDAEGMDDYHRDRLKDITVKLAGTATEAERERDVIFPLAEVIAHIQGNSPGDLEGEIEAQLATSYRDPAFSLALLSERTGKSAAYLSRFYKDRTGRNLNRTIRVMRLAEAKRLLVEADEDLDTIVASVGYSDVSSFIRMFKKETGLTPGQYRKEKRELS